MHETPGDGDAWCFVHAADLHLDTPFTGLGRVDAALARRLRSASLEAFEALVDLTLARGAALLLLAGDVYDGAERGVRAQLAVHRGLTRLAEAGVVTCIVAGNHDPLDGWSAISSWPDGVTEFGHEAPGIVEVVRDGTLLGVVTGISYEQRAETRNLATMLVRTTAEVPHIGLLHVSVGDHPEHSPYAPCSVEDLRTGGMDYWALGHIHRRQVVLDGSDGGPWAVYPGNLQGRSPKPSERGAKGASVVTVRAGRVTGVEHVSLDRARFDEVVVTVDADDDLGSVHRRLVDAARSAAEAAEGRVLVLRGVVTGRGPVHTELVRDGVVAGLLEALDDEAPADPLCAWTGLSVRTEPPGDATEADGAAGLLAELASVVDDTRAALPDSIGASLGAATAADVGLDLTEPQLLEQATALAIAHLDRGRT